MIDGDVRKGDQYVDARGWLTAEVLLVTPEKTLLRVIGRGAEEAFFAGSFELPTWFLSSPACGWQRKQAS